MSTKFPLGVFVGDPNASDAADNSEFLANYNAFQTEMGARPGTMDGFVDYALDPGLWAANAQFTAKSWAQTGANYVGAASGTTPVIGVPMSSNAGGYGNLDDFLKAIVAGSYDADYTSIVDAWADQGYKTLDLRLGYEFDGNYMPWSPSDCSSPTVMADFVTAWQHLANLVHAAGQADGIKVNTVWDPAVSIYTSENVMSLYPGNQYVDIIGTDIYSPVYAPSLANWSSTNPASWTGTYAANTTTWANSIANREHQWTYTNSTEWNSTGTSYGWSIQNAVELAELTGKPLGIAETGAGGNGTTTGPVDDAAFPEWLAGELSQPGGPQIAYVNVWAEDESDGNWGFLNGQKPAEAAAWAAYFGGTSSSEPNGSAVAASPLTIGRNAATIIGSGSDQLTLAMSETAYQGDAQFTVSVNGVQIGGVQTVTAAHGSADQSFVLRGNWGSGAQNIAINFVNAASGSAGGSFGTRTLYVDGESYDGVNTYFPMEYTWNGAQSVTVGVAGLPQATFADDKGNIMSQAIIASGSQFTPVGHLDGNVIQWVSGNTNYLDTSTFGQLVTAVDLTDGTGRNFGLIDFENVDLGLSGAANGSETIYNAAGGNIRESNGNYTTNVTVQGYCSPSVPASTNTFDISLGSGTDVFNLNAMAGWGYTTVNALSTAGTHTWSFMYPKTVDFIEEAGTDTVTVNGGTNNQFHAGGGNLIVNAINGNNNAYDFTSGDGFMTIDNFVASHGDSLWISSSLQSGMYVTADGKGGTDVNFGIGTVGIDLRNVATSAFNPGIIHWT